MLLKQRMSDHRRNQRLPCAAGAAPSVLQDDLQGELLGIASPLSIYYLGIGPYIDASWTMSLVMFAKFPAALNNHLQSLGRAGREVWPRQCACFLASLGEAPVVPELPCAHLVLDV